MARFIPAAAWGLILASGVLAAESRPAPSLTLLVPYPLTGPREIQASDRVTRRYRAVAAHAEPPVTDVMATTVEAALLARRDWQIVRQRRDDPMAFNRLRGDRAASDLLLAGDDLLRASDLDERRRTGRVADLPVVVDPLATMPFVLLCTASKCGSIGDSMARRGSNDASALRTFASAGETSTSHIAARTFLRQTGLKVLHVPYAGGNGVLGAIVAAQIDAGFVALPLALGYVRHDKVRPLAISGERRFDLLPALPTLGEAGVPIVVEAWFALFGSVRMNASEVARVAATIRSHRLESFSQSRWRARGLVPTTLSSEAFRRDVEEARSRSAMPRDPRE